MFKNINDSLYEIFVNIFQEKNKNSIIEPLICLIRLAILEFKPYGTKISIYNNRIIYNEPNLLQGAVRWSNGDSRDDLHNIYHPISKASEWYDINDTNIKNIFIYSIRGLEKLKLSYNRNSTINHSIQLYIEYLTKSLNKSDSFGSGGSGGGSGGSGGGSGGSTGSACSAGSAGGAGSGGSAGSGKKTRTRNRNNTHEIEDSTNNRNNTHEIEDSTNNRNNTHEIEDSTNNRDKIYTGRRDDGGNVDDGSEEVNTIFNKLKDIWNAREITIITNLLDELENRRNNKSYSETDIDTIITTIETLLLSKEQKVYDLIVKTTTLLE